MRLSRQCSYVLVCVLLLSIVFSSGVLANAEEIETQEYYIYTVGIVATATGTQAAVTGMQYPKDGTRQTYRITGSYTSPESDYRLSMEQYIGNQDKTAMYKKGEKITGRLENVYFTGTVKTSAATYTAKLDEVTTYIVYTDSTKSAVTSHISKDKNGYYLVEFEFTADKDVSQLYYNMYMDMPELSQGMTTTYDVTIGEPSTATESNDNIVFSWLKSEKESEEVGLLQGIIQKLTSGFENVVNAVTNLPQLIWNKIEAGLKNLFVPDVEYLSQYKDRWSELLVDRFGAVWQVVTMTIESWENINSADENNTINIPKVTIPLPDDAEFSFGGYEVQVVPQGFESLASIVKMASGIVCTFMFINGLRRKYDEVMGVEQ